MKEYGLLAIIGDYDRQQRTRLAQLEAENERLREELAESQRAHMEYIVVVDRMKLDLILSGALRKPEVAP